MRINKCETQYQYFAFINSYKKNIHEPKMNKLKDLNRFRNTDETNSIPKLIYIHLNSKNVYQNKKHALLVTHRGIKQENGIFLLSISVLVFFYQCNWHLEVIGYPMRIFLPP